MTVIRIEDPDGNLIKCWIELDEEEEDSELMINDPDDGSWVGR